MYIKTSSAISLLTAYTAPALKVETIKQNTWNSEFDRIPVLISSVKQDLRISYRAWRVGGPTYAFISARSTNAISANKWCWISNFLCLFIKEFHEEGAQKGHVHPSKRTLKEILMTSEKVHKEKIKTYKNPEPQEIRKFSLPRVYANTWI